MSFRQELMKHLTALPVTDVKKLISKYNKELDIKPVSKLKKAEILQKIRDKKPMDKQLLAKLTNEARATREGKKAQKASEKEAAKKPVEKFGTEKKKIKVKKAKPDFLDLDKDGNKKEPMKKAAKEAKKKPKAMSKEDAKALAEAFAKAPEEEKGSLFSNKTKEEELAQKYIRYDTTKIINDRNRIKMREYIEGVDFFGGPDKVPLDFVPKERIKMRYDIIKELLKKDILPKNSKPPFSKYLKENAKTLEKYTEEIVKAELDKLPKTIKDKLTKTQITNINKKAKEKAKTKIEKEYLKGESAKTETTSKIIENWGATFNNAELEQKEKRLTDTIRSQLEKKGSLNIDGLFSANSKLANDLFAKYPPQKVLDGYKKYVEYLDDEGDKEIGQDKVTDYFEAKDGRLQPTFKTKALSQSSLGKLEKANEFKLSKSAKTPEPKTSRPKGDPLKKLVSMARDHKKNGISAEGVRAYKKLVDEFLKTKPPQKEEALAKTLYNFIVNNVLRQKKKTVPNLGRLLKELGFKEM